MNIAIYILLYTMAGALGIACLFMAGFLVWLLVHPTSLERKAASWLAKQEETV